MKRIRTAVLISGSGSNMVSLARAATSPAFPAAITLVLSSNPDAGGLEKARALGLDTQSVDHRSFGRDRAAFEHEIDAILLRHRIEFIALAGFMRVLTPDFVRRWAGRMVNIHPSLLPKFRGLDTHARVLGAGEREHGCTVHWVVADLDAGPNIAQLHVPVLPGDDETTLAARVLEAEHLLYPRALALALEQFAQKRTPIL